MQVGVFIEENVRLQVFLTPDQQSVLLTVAVVCCAGGITGATP